MDQAHPFFDYGSYINPDDYPGLQTLLAVIDIVLLIIFTIAFCVAMTLIVKRKDY